MLKNISICYKYFDLALKLLYICSCSINTDSQIMVNVMKQLSLLTLFSFIFTISSFAQNKLAASSGSGTATTSSTTFSTVTSATVDVTNVNNEFSGKQYLPIKIVAEPCLI